MALTKQEQDELAALDADLSAPQGGGLTNEERNELALLEQELALEDSQPPPRVSQGEATLGVFDRARYSIEPLESNRRAFLVQQFGQENVMQDDSGEVYIRRPGEPFKPVNAPGASMADVADVAGSMFEVAPAAIGAAVGGGIPGAIAGGVAGSGIRQGASALLGVPQVATPIERVSEAGLSGVAGGAGMVAGKVIKGAKEPLKKLSSAIGRIGEKTARALPGGEATIDALEASYKATAGMVDSLKRQFGTSVAKDAGEFLEIAKKHGVDENLLPEAVKFGKESVVSRGSRFVAEGPLGEERLKRHFAGFDAVNDAIDKSVRKFSPNIPSSKVEAGEVLVNGINEASERFFSSLDDTYTSIYKNTPNIRLSKQSLGNINSALGGVEKFAKGRVARGFGSQRDEAKELLRTVDSIRKSNGSLKQTVEAMRNLGEEAFRVGKQEGRKLIDREKMQKLYFDLQKEVIETTRDVYGDDVAENLVRNNAMISDFLGEKSVISKMLNSPNIANEKVFKSLIENGDSRKIEAIKAILGDKSEPMMKLKASALDSLIQRNADGRIMYNATANKLRQKKDIISSLYSPEELKDVAELLKLGQRMGDPVLSSSGTGASNQFLNFKEKIGSSIFSEATIESMKKSGERKAMAALAPKAPPGKIRGLADAIARPQNIGNIVTDKEQRQKAYSSGGPNR